MQTIGLLGAAGIAVNVYNALPPSMHAEWTIAAVRAGMVEGVPLRSALTVEGERGRLDVGNIVLPSAGHSIRLEGDGIPRVSTVAGRTTYDHPLESVLTAVGAGSPPATEGAGPVANTAVIDALSAAAGFDRSSWS